MFVWIKRGFLPLAILGLLFTDAAQAQAPVEPLDMGMADEMIPTAPSGVVPGQFIIVLNDDVTNVRGAAAEMARAHGLGIQFIYTSALKGFAATVPEGRLNALERDPRIAYVEAVQWGGIDLTSHEFNPIAGVLRVYADMVADVDGTTVMDGHDDVRVDVSQYLGDTRGTEGAVTRKQHSVNCHSGIFTAQDLDRCGLLPVGAGTLLCLRLASRFLSHAQLPPLTRSPFNQPLHPEDVCRSPPRKAPVPPSRFETYPDARIARRQRMPLPAWDALRS